MNMHSRTMAAVFAAIVATVVAMAPAAPALAQSAPQPRALPASQARFMRDR